MLFHESKEYLNYCLVQIRNFLNNEKLELNPKTRIYKSTDNFVFLGRLPNGKFAKYRIVNRKLKKKFYLYNSNKISLASYVTSINCYNYLLKRNS